MSYSQEWHDCPECGEAAASVVFANIEAGGRVIRSDVYRFECPRGCKPSTAVLRQAFPKRLG